MNIALKAKMVEFYNRYAFTHNYIFGFRFNGNIWLVKVSSEILERVLTLDKASRGAGYALRFKPNRAAKSYMMSCGAELLCSEKFFDELCASSKYNKGEIFEKLVTELNGQLIMRMPVIGYREDLFVGDKALSRQEAARLIVTAMGLDAVAKLDIYKLSYKDKKDVAKGYTGYVAIAGAMRLIGNKTDKKFKPKTGLTRGEAAQMLLNAANVISSAE